MYRHGDLLIVKGAAVRTNWSKYESSSRVILERGETTGHAHVLESSAPIESILSGGQEVTGFITKGAFLRHEEHETITIPEGEYRVIRQKEFTDNGDRTVRD